MVTWSDRPVICGRSPAAASVVDEGAAVHAPHLSHSHHSDKWRCTDQMLCYCYSFPVKMDRPQVTAPVVSSYSQEQTYIQAQNYIHNPAAHQTPLPLYSTPQSVMYSRSGSSATCNSGTAAYVNITPMQMPIVTASYNHQQSLHKKGSLRNGDVLKRSRVQTMYVFL